jgi:hypothetical protein
MGTHLVTCDGATHGKVSQVCTPPYNSSLFLSIRVCQQHHDRCIAADDKSVTVGARRGWCCGSRKAGRRSKIIGWTREVKPSTKSRISRQKLPSKLVGNPRPISCTILDQIERDHSRCKANFWSSRMQENSARTVDRNERTRAPKSREKHTCPLAHHTRLVVTRWRFSPCLLNQKPRNKSHSKENLYTYAMDFFPRKTMHRAERCKLAKSGQKHSRTGSRPRGGRPRGQNPSERGKKRRCPLDISGSDGRRRKRGVSGQRSA